MRQADFQDCAKSSAFDDGFAVPHLGANLVTALASLHVNDLTHCRSRVPLKVR